MTVTPVYVALNLDPRDQEKQISSTPRFVVRKTHREVFPLGIRMPRDTMSLLTLDEIQLLLFSRVRGKRLESLTTGILSFTKGKFECNQES